MSAARSANDIACNLLRMQYIPYIAIAWAFALIYLPRQVVGREITNLDGGYDNNDPRAQQAKLEGRGKRALAAHNNTIEAFAPFGIAVLAAVQRAGKLEIIVACAVAFAVARTIYVLAYLADKSKLRSGMWTLGIAAIGVLMIV